MTPLFKNKMICHHFCYGFSLRPSRGGVCVRSLRKTVEDNEQSEVLNFEKWTGFLKMDF